MTRLELVQRLNQEAGASGTITTTIAQTGQNKRMVDWIDTAWNDIQIKNDDWTWMRASNLLGSGVEFETIAGDYDYPLGTGPGTVGVEAEDFGKWDLDTFRLHTTALGINDETMLEWVTYDQWRDAYMLGAQRSVETRPTVFSTGPGELIVLGSPPTDAYTVTADYFVAPSVMTLDADTPSGLPLPFHLMIVWLALTYYAGFESAPDALSRGQAGYGPMMRKLERLRAQRVGHGPALA